MYSQKQQLIAHIRISTFAVKEHIQDDASKGLHPSVAVNDSCDWPEVDLRDKSIRGGRG